MYFDEEKKPITHSILIKVIFIFTGIVLGFLISRFFFQTFTVSDNSMLPNLQKGDRTVILKIVTPDIGDIVLKI